MKIRVTQDCIDAAEGIRGSATAAQVCPIAIALRVTGFDVNAVGCYWITTSEGDFGTPAKASEFIERFDARYPVRPFTFELAL